MNRSTLMLLLKAAVSLLLIAFLVSRIHIPHLLEVISSAHLSYLMIAMTAYLLGQGVSSLRWALLAWPLGFEDSLKKFTIFYFIAMFFNLFAPSTIGGDVGRVLFLAQARTQNREKGWKDSTAYAFISVITDRAIGMAVMVWIGAAALAMFPRYALPPAIRYPTFAIALVCLVGWTLLPYLDRFLRRREYAIGQNLHRAVETYWSNQHIILQTIGLSFVVHFLQVWIQIVVGRALDINLPWSYSFIVYPLVGLFSALPVSLSGIGLREGGYLFLLRRIDVSPEKAVAFGILWFVIVALDSLLGGIVLVLRKRVAFVS